MNLRKLLILVIIFTCLSNSGCFFWYKSLKSSEGQQAFDLWRPSNCIVKYSISIKQTHFNEEITEFKQSPYKEDYAQWVIEALDDVNCKGIPVDTESSPDLNLVITDEFPYRSGVGQGVGILAMMTLYIFPIPSGHAHRTYEFEYKGSIKKVEVVEKNWTGWIFLPAFPLSYLAYEKHIFTTQLKKYIPTQRLD